MSLTIENYFIYIIANPEGIYYKGITSDIDKRLVQHNSPLGKYTSFKGPWKLIFLKKFTDKSEALKYEKMLKRQNHRYLDWLILSDKNELN
jgi:putative endonuclease